MPAGRSKDRLNRSQSNDSLGDADSNADSVGDDSVAGNFHGSEKKSGDVKGLDQRKVQNRIAQREFRQRKQQYVKDLEARVELQEASRDEQLDQLRTTLKALIDENQQLRELLASVAGFIGDGIGGYLQQVGSNYPEFKTLISRNRTDRTREVLKENFHPTENGDRPEQGSGSGSRHNSDSGPPSKRKKSSNDIITPESAPTQDRSGSGPRPKTPHTAQPAPFSSVENPESTGTAAASSTPAVHSSNSLSKRSSALSRESPKDSGDFSAKPAQGGENGAHVASKRFKRGEEVSKAGSSLHSACLVDDMSKFEGDVEHLFTSHDQSPMVQSIQLIMYHMRNKRELPNYHLPPSLKATVTQQSVPHNQFFDGIIFASLRDRLILLRDQYDFGTLMHDLLEAMQIHDNDILLPENWEISEKFLKQYWYVIDQEVLSICNRHRERRGEPSLQMRDLVPNGADTTRPQTLASELSP